ncbi:Hypothetical predicted protein [Paramuricea clavata]|uniref:Uncharacterized protein n=1 Tax=Paramuricea clavata TaxID=317549 RepID=A0A7D9JGG6_PARCT|nr:Hypothetical predicted protein [Paramuricea clavata]
MAESFSGAGEALRAIVSWNPVGGEFAINISTDNVEVAREVCKTVTTLGALYIGYQLIRPLIEGAVRNGLGGERDDQEVRGIRPGSLHVRLHCFTDERFLAVLADYESGRIKERLQDEFSQIGIKVEGLKVEIKNMVEVNKTKEAINNDRSHINKDLNEDVKNIVINDGESKIKKELQVKILEK